MSKLKELLETRAKAHEQMKNLIVAADKENRKMTAEESEAYNRAEADFDGLTKDIERRQKVEQAGRLLDEPAAGAPPAERRSTQEPEEEDLTSEAFRAKETRAFDSYIRYGMAGMSQEQRATLSRRRISLAGQDLRLLPPEVRAQVVGTGSAGGFLVPEGFSGELEKALKAFGGVRAVARTLTTSMGNDIPWPTVDDTSNTGALVAEIGAITEQDAAFGQVILKAWKYTSKYVKVSIELLQDSFIDVGAILRDLLAERVGRITNTHFTTGDDSGKPQGVVNAASQGFVAPNGTSQVTAIIAESLFDLVHSLDPAYRLNASFMLNDQSLKIIRKLRDASGGAGTGDFLFRPGLTQGEPNTILGYSYTINQDVASMAASAKSILFGDFRKYIVRDVMPFALIRLDELFALNGQVAFLALSRHDGRGINSSGIKYLQNAAS